MTKEEKVKFLAELDGWSHCYITKYGVCGWLPVEQSGTIHGARGDNICKIPYLTSYDAIIRLVQKQPRHILTKMVLSMKGQNDVSRMVDWLMFSPEELADILIKVIDKERAAS